MRLHKVFLWQTRKKAPPVAFPYNIAYRCETRRFTYTREQGAAADVSEAMCPITELQICSPYLKTPFFSISSVCLLVTCSRDHCVHIGLPLSPFSWDLNSRVVSFQYLQYTILFVMSVCVSVYVLAFFFQVALSHKNYYVYIIMMINARCVESIRIREERERELKVQGETSFLLLLSYLTLHCLQTQLLWIFLLILWIVSPILSCIDKKMNIFPSISTDEKTHAMLSLYISIKADVIPSPIEVHISTHNILP